MSIFLEMLQAARRAPSLLGESLSLVRSFFAQQQNQDGGFKDRAGRSDLYYTVFGLGGLAALNPTSPQPSESDAFRQAALRAEPYVHAFASGPQLDLVHLACLARVQALLSANRVHPAAWDQFRPAMVEHLESYRCADGGYNPNRPATVGTVYASFLALGAYQDLQVQVPAPERLAESLHALALSDGSWRNEIEPGQPGRGLSGSTNSTAAALAVLRQLGESPSPKSDLWLKARFHPQGGFVAAPTSPIPDLLSTATALHALAVFQNPEFELRERCLDFVDTLWTNEGGFYGHWGDDHLDCEYTFYGLLALGHLVSCEPATPEEQSRTVNGRGP